MTIVLSPSSTVQTTTLTGYITEVRRLLHDATGQWWSDAELTDYINAARERVVRDSGCYRFTQIKNLTANIESYPFSSFPQSSNTFDVLNCTIQWGQSRIALSYLVWTEFNARARYYMNYVGRPTVFTIYAENTLVVAPIPDQTYVSELDTVVRPPALSTTSSNEVLPFPFQAPVAYWAAKKAKFKEQSFGEADRYAEEYRQQILAARNSVFTRRILNPYAGR